MGGRVGGAGVGGGRYMHYYYTNLMHKIRGNEPSERRRDHSGTGRNKHLNVH